MKEEKGDAIDVCIMDTDAGRLYQGIIHNMGWGYRSWQMQETERSWMKDTPEARKNDKKEGRWVTTTMIAP